MPAAASADFVQPLLPTAHHGPARFNGTADAVRQNLHLLDRLEPDVVAVFAADHVYRMDVQQMLAFHRMREADATVAALPVPIEHGSAFGIISADASGQILRFDEKPQAPACIPGNPRFAYASMGNYLFQPDVLAHALAEAAERHEHDFGRHVLPWLIRRRRVYAYDFGENSIPNVQPHEERGYWRDVGTLEAYEAAHRDVMGPTPRFQLRNDAWPICPLGLAPLERPVGMRHGISASPAERAQQPPSSVTTAVSAERAHA